MQFLPYMARSLSGCDTFMGICRYARMPYDASERSMCLFAREVMPELQSA